MIPKNIILHHSLTKDDTTENWNSIRKYHIFDLGWNDIGYHFGIEKIGKRYEILTGRFMNQRGAHTKQDNMNSQSLGICFVGNFDQDFVPNDMWMLGIEFVRSLMAILKISKFNVYGHREFAHYKSCPGEKFDLDSFRAQL